MSKTSSTLEIGGSQVCVYSHGLLLSQKGKVKPDERNRTGNF